MLQAFCILSLLTLQWVYSSFNPQFELIAEFVTVDYEWDATHTKDEYEQTGQFIVQNNAITGVKVASNGDIYVTVPRWLSGNEFINFF